MAFATGNVDRKFGLQPIRHARGGTIRNANPAYRIAASYGTSIFNGDLVALTGTGKEITNAAANARAVGTFAGCFYTAADGSFVFSPYYPASVAVKAGSEIVAMVFDDPDIMFEIQASGAFAAADVGAGADILAGTGNPATGLSAMQLDSTSIAVNNDRNLLIMGLVDRADNAYGTNAKVAVMIQKHQLAGGGTAV